jgi:hypothetical protein
LINIRFRLFIGSFGLGSKVLNGALVLISCGGILRRRRGGLLDWALALMEGKVSC